MKSKMTKSKVVNKATGLKNFLDSMSKPKMKKGGFPDLNKDGKVTKADILMGRGVINKPKGQMGMNVMKEAKKNATPSIPNSYYKMGGKTEKNPLGTIVKKNNMNKASKSTMMKKGGEMKPKYGMGGPFFKGYPAPLATKGDNFPYGESLKKGGMIKKKK